MWGNLSGIKKMNMDFSKLIPYPKWRSWRSTIVKNTIKKQSLIPIHKSMILKSWSISKAVSKKKSIC